LATAYGAEVIRLEAPWGEAVDPQRVAEALEENPDVRAVYLTHCETSTGVLHDVEAIAALVRRTDALLVVDAVSSLGAVPLPMDAWGVDVLVTGSQKALMLPPGLGFVALSDRAWEVAERNQNPRFYLDLRAYRKQLAANTTPYTAAVSLVYGLAEALDLIEAEGLPRIYERHVLLQRMTREAMKALGLPLFTPDEIASPTVTAVLGEGFDPERLRNVLREDFQIAVAGGQQQLKGRIFRIGHMGYCSPVDILQVIAALEVSLARIGVSVELGRGVEAAQRVFLEHQLQQELQQQQLQPEVVSRG
jgi:aspartate aminotransferase-like enzyme